MQIFYDRTKVEVEPLKAIELPEVETRVIRYKPEDRDRTPGYAPTIIYSATTITVPNEAPEWVERALVEAAMDQGFEVKYGGALLERATTYFEPDYSEADVLRLAIRRHDETVDLVRWTLFHAAEQREAKTDAPASA